VLTALLTASNCPSTAPNTTAAWWIRDPANEELVPGGTAKVNAASPFPSSVPAPETTPAG